MSHEPSAHLLTCSTALPYSLPVFTSRGNGFPQDWVRERILAPAFFQIARPRSHLRGPRRMAQGIPARPGPLGFFTSAPPASAGGSVTARLLVQGVLLLPTPYSRTGFCYCRPRTRVRGSVLLLVRESILARFFNGNPFPFSLRGNGFPRRWVRERILAPAAGTSAPTEGGRYDRPLTT